MREQKKNCVAMWLNTGCCQSQIKLGFMCISICRYKDT